MRCTIAAFLLLLLGCAREGSTVPPPRVWSAAEIALPLAQPRADLPAAGAAAPQRIISLIPSYTEFVCALGMETQLVGRSRWCDTPPSVLALPDLGGLQDFSAEHIADLKPDVVLLFDCLPGLQRTLQEDLHIRVITPPTEREDQFVEGLRSVAAALDCSARGEALIAELNQQLKAVEAAHANGPHPRVLVVLDRNPPFAACAGSFVDQLVRLCGGVNAVRVPPMARPWCTLSAEALLDLAPEVIVDLSIGDDAIAAQRAGAEYWAALPTIPAVRSGRVHLLNAPVLARPGPRMAEAAALLARIIHAPGQ